jgi:two-component system copper resistance phosphate regulon response regulator CusR
LLNHSSKPSILVIDDDLDTLTLLRTVLRNGGYDVSTASCWSEITDRLNMALTSRRAYAAIILDLMMPERSGWDVLNSLKVILNKTPPVIILSARYSTQDMVRASEMGASKYLVKPTKPDRLLETLREVIRQRQNT